MAQIETPLTLTAEQQRIVDLDDGAFVLVAPPGSGKTEVLAQRIVRLIQASEGQSFKVLALSFTKNAAASMWRRVGERLGEFTWRVTCTTYHSFCMDILRSYAERIRLPNDFTLYDSQDDRLQALAQGLVEEGLLDDVAELKRPDALRILDAIGRLKRDLVPPTAAPSQPVGASGISLQDAYRAYELALSLNGAIDFDGTIQKTYELLKSDDAVSSLYRDTYRYLLIDEAQDTNAAQFALLQAFCGTTHRNVLIVADPAQSIYSFAGASSRYVALFTKEFRAKRFELGMTFRCGSEILRFARPLLHENTSKRLPAATASSAKGSVEYAELQSEFDEATFVVDWAKRIEAAGLPLTSIGKGEERDVRPEQMAILARNRNCLRHVLEVLDAGGADYHFATGDGGLFDTDEYRAILYGLKWLANGKDLAIGRGFMAALGQAAPAADLSKIDSSRTDPIAVFQNVVKRLKDAPIADGIQALVAGRGAGPGPLRRAMELLIEWDPSTKASSQEQMELLAADRELLEARWISYRNRPDSSDRGWQGLVLELVSTPRPEAPGLRVMTIHAAKGLEFKAVAIVGLNDGTFPDFRSSNADELDSERRLMYVAMTRASRAVLLTRAATRATRYGMRLQQPSRFLDEMNVPS